MMFVSMAHMMGDQDKRSKKGLLDTLGAASIGAFSLRLLTGAYKGNCCNIRRSSDNAQSDIGFDSFGNFNVGQFSSFVGGGTGFVTKIYDQSGSKNDASQGTAATQPQISLAVTPHARATMVFGGSQNLASASVSLVAPMSIAAYAERTGAFTSFGIIMVGSTNGGPQLFFQNSTNSVEMGVFGGVAQNATAADSAFHSLVGVVTSSLTSITVDGTTTSGGTTTPSSVSAVIEIGASSAGNSATADISEAIMFSNVALSAAQIASIASSQAAYW